MSLIEQASKRLEELRRAGATEPDTGLDAQPASGDDVTPTPEAVIRALERNELHGSAAAGHTAAGTRPSTAAPHPSRQVRARQDSHDARHVAPPRRVDLDLAMLKARGLVTPDAPTSKIADEFRVIKRPIIRNALGRSGARLRNGNLVMVTSSVAGEGKTFTALNLAMSVAMEYDSTVLLVDGDVAHPGLPRVLGIPESPGLLDLVTDDTLDVSRALLKTNIEKLSLLPAGSPQRRATELLASEQMVSLLHEISNRYLDRIVIFDSPPLLATTEARVLAGHMGQIVMVVAAESTSQNTLNQALSTIENCEVVLMMLNKASQTDVGTYGYYPADGSR